MQICYCENPRIKPAVRPGDMPSCELCGFYWDGDAGSKLPAGKRRHVMPAAAPSLFAARDVPIVTRHPTVHVDGVPDAKHAMTPDRAQSVAAELCEFNAESTRAWKKGDRCFVEIKWNAMNIRTFSGASYFIALRGVLAHVRERAEQKVAVENAKLSRKTWWRRTFDWFTSR